MPCVIVTGAAGGIGSAICKKFAESGYNVVINHYKTLEMAEELAKELPTESLIIEGDISKWDDAKELMDKTVEKFGQIDVLVNNAGITKDGLLMRMEESAYDAVLAVNLKGTFNCIRHCVPYMMKKKAGKIINISSIVGVMGNAGQANYCASKAGVIGLTKSVAKEIGSRGITVNAIAPGFIKTAMTDAMPEKARENMIENITLKRLGLPEDIANVATFLASESASYITGQVIAVDGGLG